MPAELKAFAPQEEAQRIARHLETAGAEVGVVPTEEIESGRFPVEFRACEQWPTRIASNQIPFTEIEDMVFIGNPITNVRKMRERSPSTASWQLERYLNHQHPTNDYDRRALQKARKVGDQLSEALRELYPERCFVIDYLEEQVSFYQPPAALPPRSLASLASVRETKFCYVCGTRTAYRVRLTTDQEFPEALWGDCNGCGNEMLLQGGEVYVLIGPR